MNKPTDNTVPCSSRIRLILLAVVGVVAFSLLIGISGPNSDKLSSGEHYADLGDVRLHYTVAGSGPLLILCSPGWGIGARYLELGLEPLGAHFKLLFIDTRGSGKSSRPADPHKMSDADMADDIEHLRAILALKQISVLGHSDSGSIALDFAERYPSSIEKLIFVDGATQGESSDDKAENAERERLLQAASTDLHFKAAVEALSKPPIMTDEGMAQYLKDTLPVFFANVANIPAFAKTTQDTKPSSWAWQFHDKANLSRSWQQEEHLGEVRAKTLVIVGKQDRICPALIAEHVHTGIRGSQLVEIDKSGHFPWIEQPDQFFDSVVRFMH